MLKKTPKNQRKFRILMYNQKKLSQKNNTETSGSGHKWEGAPYAKPTKMNTFETYPSRSILHTQFHHIALQQTT